MPFREHLNFVTQTLKHFRLTGAIAPSSAFLARAMTRSLDRRPPVPWRILEVGAGTGPMTSAIVRKMRDGDELECYELNPDFCRHLRRRFQHEVLFRRRARQVVIVEQDICGLPAGRRYDLVVCSLPFNNFQPELAQQIMALLCNALQPGASLVFFEYLFLRQAVQAVNFNRQERERLAKIEKIVDTFCRRGDYRQEIVWMNLPPAMTREIKKPRS